MPCRRRRHAVAARPGTYPGARGFSEGAAPAQLRRGSHMSSSKLRVALVGVGNCASSLVQGVAYYRNAAQGPAGARADACRARRLPCRRHRVLGRLRHQRGQGRPRPGRGDPGPAQQHLPLRRGPGDRRRGAARADPGRPRPLRGAPHRANRPSPPVDVARGAARQRHRGRRQLPAGRLRAGDPLLRRGRRSRPAAPSSTASPCSSPPTRAGRSASPSAACR